MVKKKGDETEEKKEMPLHIGLTGCMGSGKGEVARCFEQFHFHYISLSDIVREEIRQRTDISRSQMQDIGNKLREEGGPAILARRVIRKIKSSLGKKWIIDGIRNPAEVLELKKLCPFHLIGVSADTAVILKRIDSRKRGTDRINISKLKKTIEREWGAGEPENGQQVGKCMKMADYTLENNGSLEELKKKCRKILSIIEGKHAE